MASEIKVDTIVNAGGDNDSGIDLATNDIVKVNIAGAEKARVHSDGKLQTDHLVNLSGDSDSGIDLSTNDIVTVKTANTERMRVDASGNVGIGTSSPTGKLTVDGGSIHLGNNGEGVVFGSDTNTNNSIFGNATSNFIGLQTNGSERMRLTSTGLAIGDSMEPTRHGAITECLIFNDSTTTGHTALHCGRIGTGTETQIIFSNAAGQRGNITTNASAVQYNTTSDYRLKENIVTDWDATSRLKQLKPSRFNFKVDEDTTVDGFLAHEVSDVVPEAITGTKDAVDADGNPEYQGIDQSKLVPLLTKALQEAIAKIETLEAKVTALESE